MPTLRLHDEYEQLALLRANVGFRIASARRRRDGAPCVVITPSREANVALARAALSLAAEAHARIDHRSIPKTSRLIECDDRPLLELDAHAVGDAIELTRRWSASDARIPLSAADAFIVGVRRALEGAHAAVDPESGLPYCIGRISAANTLFTPEGRTLLVGFGHNFALEDAARTPDPRIPHFAAHDFNLGSPATPSGDYVALLAFMRANLSFVDKRGALARIFRAITTRSDDALLELLFWVERRVVGAVPSERASIAEAVATANRVRALLEIVPDERLFASIVARSFADPSLAPEPPPSQGMRRLDVGPDAEWIRVDDGEARRLRGAMRRVLLALSEQQQSGAPAPLRSVELAEIGWPDERLEYEASLNRVYVTMNRLRKLLPDGVLERHDDGYRLSPSIAVRVASA